MKERLQQFWKIWMLAAMPLILLGWLAGKLNILRHGYIARELPNLADFTMRHWLAPGLAAGVAFGFWLALVLVLAKALTNHPRRARRAFFLVIGLGIVGVACFIAYNLPGWSRMAASAAYTGQQVNLVYGIALLALAEVVQATWPQRLASIVIAGILATIAIIPLSYIERRIFRAEPKPCRERQWPGRFAVVALAVNGLFMMAFFVGERHHAPADHPPVIWISIDTLRADHMSIYGYERLTTPNLDALAADGVVVEQFISQAPWTLPTHATMFSGLAPAEHGLHTQAHRFSPRTPLFPELLKERGYRNGAVTSGLLLAPNFGYSAGFNRYEMNLDYHAQTIVKRGLSWLSMSDNPSFLFLHIFDPHYPYHCPPLLGKYSPVNQGMQRMQLRNFFEFAKWVKEKPETRLQQTIDRYDEEITYVDHQLGWLFKSLKDSGLYDKAWIIVVSDHGEEFLEHGQMGHSATMYEELTRVPMIIKAPNSPCAGTRYSAGQIPQSAIAELILRVAQSSENTGGAAICNKSDGVLQVLHDIAADGPIMGDCRIFGPARFMARLPDKKLHSPTKIHKGDMLVDHDFELFNLAVDPGETMNIYAPDAAPALEGSIKQAYTDLAENEGQAVRHKLDPETIQKLKSLGYIQ